MNTKTVVSILVVVAVACALGVGWYATTHRTVATKTPIVALTVDEIQTLINKVSKHIAVNMAEKPTVATIQDVNILRTQNPDFYKDAQNGDRLIIWSDKAVLYSPTKDKLLAVLPIRLPATAQAATK